MMICKARIAIRQICASPMFVFKVVFATFGIVMAPPAGADGWRIGIYSGQWADTRLPYLPYNAATGRLAFDDSYLTSVIVSRHLLTRDLFIPHTSVGFSDARIEFEGTANFHGGLQSHEEVTLGLMLRTRDYDLASSGTINFGWANGFLTLWPRRRTNMERTSCAEKIPCNSSTIWVLRLNTHIRHGSGGVSLPGCTTAPGFMASFRPPGPDRTSSAWA